MFERTRLAVRRLLTMSNLFENLYQTYGDREALILAEPPAGRMFASCAMSYGDCLRFTNLAAEAYVRELDLKKGERVIVISPDDGELLLLVAALAKAGGIAVPLEDGLTEEEIGRLASGCGAGLALVDGRVLARRPGLLGGVVEHGRLMASGPSSSAPPGVATLDEAMERSSGFFLPYTLKPSNVVALLHEEMGDGSLKAVMVTNEGLLGRQLLAALPFPARPGGPCVCAIPMRRAAGFSAAVLGLCMGLRMCLAPEADPGRIMEALDEHKPHVFMAASGTYLALRGVGASGSDLSSVRLWLSAGGSLPRSLAEECLGYSGSRWGMPAAFVETYGAGGNATILALKVSSRFIAWPEGCPGFIVPPNRARVMDESGRLVRRGGEGELCIRGPSVTPGYWNDVEGTLEAKRDGWLRTGIKARARRFFIMSVSGDGVR